MMYGKKWGVENWVKALKGYEPEKAQNCLQIDFIRDNCGHFQEQEKKKDGINQPKKLDRGTENLYPDIKTAKQKVKDVPKASTLKNPLFICL